MVVILAFGSVLALVPPAPGAALLQDPTGPADGGETAPQDPQDPRGRDPRQPGTPSQLGDGVGRRCRIGRILAADAPRVDGHLTDACWATAPKIGPLITVEPFEQLVPDQRTEVRLVHDETHLYMAVSCFDTHPEGIRATQRRRDADLDPDDRVEFLFDPFGNYNIGYWFQIGAGGSRGDALLGNNGSSFNKSWDTIWYARARITERGWFAEVAIPFQSIAFPDGVDTWRFNLTRRRRQDNAEYRWASARQGLRFFRVSESGSMTGIGEVEHGYGIDIVPFIKFSRGRQRLDGVGWESDPDAGGDLFVRITPSLTAVATAYTDFAQTENDERQINLTRFPLFFPEKRDFFLQDASRFEFGPSRGFRRRPSLIPFFSRRIGLAEGEEIPILAGLKAAGEEGPWEVGFLSVITDDATIDVDDVPTDLSRKDLTVLRLTHKLGEQSRLGGILTHGRPFESGDNTVVGVDWSDRFENVFGGQELRLFAFALGSQTSGGGGDGNAWGLTALADGREWDWEASTLWITDDFNPELGFVRRRDIKDFQAQVQWEPRLENGSAIRNLDFGVETRAILDTGNTVTDYELELRPFGLRAHSGDRFSVELARQFERVDTDFTIFDDIVVVAGDYWTSRVSAFAESSDGRPVTVEVRGSIGDLFDGSSWEASGGVSWRPIPLVQLSGEYSTTRGRLERGDFTSRIAEGTVDLLFTPDVSLQNLVQFDNDSNNLGLQSRLRWILEPGSDLFVVATSGWLKGTDGTLRPDAQEVTVKLAHTIRF